MVIKQARVSLTLEKYFGKEFRSKWKLEKYYDPNLPAIFLGLYKNEDFDAFLSHKSFRLFVLGGSDMTPKNFLRLQEVINDGRTFTCMHPGEISNTLSQNNIPHKHMYIQLKDYSKYKPVPLGDKIYVYFGASRQDLSYYKWEEIVEPLISQYGKDRIIFTKNQTSNYLINSIYPQAFVYIKPAVTGGTTTMWELGHMGIRTLGKGDLLPPNFTQYFNVDHLISLITEEEKYISKTRVDVATEVKELFETSKNWLDLDFWK